MNTPVPSCPGPSHTVAAGETLESIASAFGLTLAALVEANPQLITIGQELCVPAATSASCAVLSPTAAAPANAAGVVLAQISSGSLMIALVGAANLPSLSGTTFDTYFARFVAPDGTSITFPLRVVSLATTPTLYAGGMSGIPAAATMVLVFAGSFSEPGVVGPVLLQGDLGSRR